jgi:hypothetical protein
MAVSDYPAARGQDEVTQSQDRDNIARQYASALAKGKGKAVPSSDVSFLQGITGEDTLPPSLLIELGDLEASANRPIGTYSSAAGPSTSYTMAG